jgi:hypothetical protein
MRFGFGSFLPMYHHHGENIHRIGQAPERVACSKSPDLLTGSRGSLLPAEMKRLIDY